MPRFTNKKNCKKQSMLTITSILVCAATLSTQVSAQGTVLHCGQMVDVESLQMLSERSIIIENDRIVRVSSGYSSPENGATVIELRDHTCMPGLMDLHVHLAIENSPRSTLERFTLNPADYAFRSAVHAESTLMAGFTTVRDLGNIVGVPLRNAINQGLVKGPRMHVAGNVSTTGGHGDPTNGFREDLMGSPGPEMGIINGPEDATQAVRQRYKDGADLIKITATGGVLSLAPNGEGPHMSEAEIRAVVTTAADYGFHVAAHAHGAEGIKRSIRAGVQTIEHGTLMDDEGIALMKEYGTYYVPTISAGEFAYEKSQIEGFFPEIIRLKAEAIGPQIKGTFGKAYAAGVKIAFGTDAGVPAHGSNGREFILMVEAGMPPLETIRSATLTASVVLGVQGERGTFIAGKLADIVAVPGDPSEDISVMERISFVMKGGVVYKGPEL
jgi:imidazolonepropionase-like amidohydrolase